MRLDCGTRLDDVDVVSWMFNKIISKKSIFGNSQSDVSPSSWSLFIVLSAESKSPRKGRQTNKSCSDYWLLITDYCEAMSHSRPCWSWISARRDPLAACRLKILPLKVKDVDRQTVWIHVLLFKTQKSFFTCQRDSLVRRMTWGCGCGLTQQLVSTYGPAAERESEQEEL